MLGFLGAAADGFYPGFSRAHPAPAAISWDMVQMPGPGDAATGSVRLRSLDPRDTPIIDFDFFSGDAGQRDLEALVEGANLVLRIFDQTSGPVAPFTLFESEAPVNSTQFFKDRTFGHHATGTCRMGPLNDRSACVDSSFRVQGVKGLRVADASVFPRAPGAWPTVPTYMMGLKLADILTQEDGKCA
jgi:choline dehydrogenase